LTSPLCPLSHEERGFFHSSLLRERAVLMNNAVIHNKAFREKEKRGQE
jgi:hypothetical protein